MEIIDNKIGAELTSFDVGASFEPEARPKPITFRIAMTCGLTPSELEDYDRLDDADAAFERVRAVKTLHLEWQSCTGIEGLDAFDGVEFLYLQYNRIERIEGLDSLCNLRFLALQHNRLRAVEGLLELRQLGLLDLSRNLVGQLDERELPAGLLILNLEGNACTGDAGYRERVLARCPQLEDLDGRSLATGLPVEAQAGAGAGQQLREPGDGEVREAQRGLTAYWQRSEMQTGSAELVRDQIASYSVESLADCDRFGARVEQAVERSLARRRDVALRPKTPSLGASMGTSLTLSGSLTKDQLASIRALQLSSQGSEVLLHPDGLREEGA